MSTTHRMNRRTLLRSGVAAVLVTAGGVPMSACSDPRASDRLAFLNWQDYIAPDLLRDFERGTGIAVTYETYPSNDALARRVGLAQRTRRGGRSSTSFDLVVPSDNFVSRFRSAGALAELDHDQLPNLDNLAPSFRNAAFDPGNRFSVPWATGTTGIGYDRTVFGDPPGYDVFLDPAHRGRTTVLAETRDAFGLALLSLGEDANTRDPSTIRAAEERLIEMKGVIRGFESAGYLDGLAVGELVAAHGYSSDILQAAQRNPDIGYVLPPEGALRWVDSMVVLIDAARPGNAHRFIDHYLEPEVSAGNATAVQVDTGNAAVRELLPAEMLDDPAIFPPDEVLDRLVFTADLGADETLYDEAWERVQEA
jgi:spermidine/putrescine-binding protein